MIKVTKEQNQKAGVRKTGNRMIPYGWLPLKTKKLRYQSTQIFWIQNNQENNVFIFMFKSLVIKSCKGRGAYLQLEDSNIRPNFYS